MSAPPSASAHGTPGPGYYPDPSIPGYIRYWNGAAWVPGTSRPAPPDGEPMPAPPDGAAPPQPAPSAPAAPSGPSGPSGQEEAPREETGPVFLDEEDGPGDAPAAPPRSGTLPEVRGRGEVDLRPGGRSEPASAWQADASRQSGFDGERDDRVSWGAAPALGAGRAPQALEPGSDPRGGWKRADAGPAGGGDAPPRTEGTMRMRPVRPADGGAPAAPAAGRREATGPHTPEAARPAPVPAPMPAPAPAPAPMPMPAPAPAASEQPSWTRQVQELAQRAPASGAPAPGPGAAPAPAVPAQQSPAGAPAGPERVVPWKPPTVDPFLQAAQRQARPAGLGRRLAARAVDGIVTAAVTGAVAFPFVGPSVEHVREEIEAVEQAGVTRQVWLVDGTTGVYLAIVLGAFLLFGLLYEVLPTARWGRTLGKKLFGLTVLDIEEQDTPSFGAALRRWLVYGPLSLVGIGLVDAFWCVVDKPWRQCWHDKAARTFVARGSE
ncbi:RDD family protein [Streptomyces glaucosporus]